MGRIPENQKTVAATMGYGAFMCDRFSSASIWTIQRGKELTLNPGFVGGIFTSRMATT